MVQQMSTTPQPHFLSALVADFGSFAASNGFAVNLVVVIALAAMGVIFLTGRPRLVRYAVWFGLAFCLADWVLVQDFGFLGGLGTDPNSMIPWILLFTAGYLALTPTSATRQRLLNAAAPEPAAVGAAAAERDRGRRRDAAGRGWRERLRPLAPRAAGTAIMSASARSAAAVAALAVILVGVVPMAAAAANRTADPILAEAIAGDTAPIDLPAPGFRSPTRTASRSRWPACAARSCC